MKKILAVILILALLMCTGCSKLAVETIDSIGQTKTEPTKAPVSSTPAPTETPAVEAAPEPNEVSEPEPTAEPVSEPEPNTVSGKLVYERSAAVLKELKRGDQVEILEEQGEYCSVKVGETTGLVKKSLLRTGSSSAFQSWSGYTGFNAELFKNYKLTGSSTTPYLNTSVTVIDEYDDCYVLSLGNETYYAVKDAVNRYTVQYYTYNDGGSGNGGNGGSGNGGGNSENGIDGGDINLNPAANFGSGYVLTQLGAVNSHSSRIPTLLDDTGAVVASTVSASVKVDGAELILCFIEPGTELRVIERGDSICTVYYEGTRVSLPSCLVKLDTDAEYKAWTGYAARFAPCHSSHLLNDKVPTTLVTNSQLTILDDLGMCYVISVNGQYRFIAYNQVNRSPVNYMAGYTAPAESDGGGGGSSEIPELPEEGIWTDPVL